MQRQIAVITVAMLATACASSAARGPAAGIDETALLSGEAIFGETVDTSGIRDPGLFEIDDDMRAFVAEHVDNTRANRERMRRLLSGMIETGLMSLDYNDARTKTARQTFHDRVGNCISFTSMFVALAREADLNVSFQTVEVPPIWYSDSDLVILNNHVNALVKFNFGSKIVVDFNVTELKGDYETREVSDEYALALYFNNIAMDALRAGDDVRSFRLLKKSIETYPDIAANWANLGVIYSRNNAYPYAIKAYEMALDIDRDHRQSLTNLTALYRNAGDDEAAEFYGRQIRRYQNQNPYYHYYQALAAYNTGDLEGATRLLDKAIHRKDSEHMFYRLRGQIAERRGDREQAVSNFRKARELAVYSDARSIYENKIELLTSIH